MRLLTTFVAISLFAAGCSPPATIHKKDGTSVRGAIVKGSRLSVKIESDDPNVRTRISRSEIESVRHPGTIMTIISVSTMAVGLVVSLAGLVVRPLFDYEYTWVPGLAVSGLSATFAVWGLTTICISKSRYDGWFGDNTRNTDDDGDGILVAPLVLSDDEATYFGAGLGWRF